MQPNFTISLCVFLQVKKNTLKNYSSNSSFISRNNSDISSNGSYRFLGLYFDKMNSNTKNPEMYGLNAISSKSSLLYAKKEGGSVEISSVVGSTVVDVDSG